MGIALSLPRADAVTEELLGDVAALSPGTLAEVRELLGSALAPLAAEIPAGERLVLDAFAFATARRHPERCAQPDRGFTPSPATCRRAVGLAAVERCLRRRAQGPLQAVAQVLEAGEEDAALARRGELPRAPWWAGWYAELGAGARAVVAAEAVTWATQLWTALAWDQLPGPVTVGGHDDWWDVPGTRALTLRGRADVRARLGPRAALVVVGSGTPDAGHRAELVFPALVASLSGSSRAVPGRVLGLWPACGLVRVVPVDAAALLQCAEDVVAAVGTWVDGLIERAGVPASGGPRLSA